MYNPNEALRRYQETSRQGMSTRETEVAALTQAASLMGRVLENWGQPELGSRLDEALSYNQQIWTIFRSELARLDSPLPKDLREMLLGLGVFVDRRIYEILAYPDRDKVDALIAINLKIASGLSDVARAAPDMQGEEK